MFVLSTGTNQSTLLISHNGINDENCGISLPCQTIAYTLSKRAKDGDVIKLEKDLAEISQPFNINAQPLLLRNITLMGTNGKPTIRGESFIFDDKKTPSTSDVRYVTIRIVNLILKGTGIIRFKKNSGALNVIINNCTISGMLQNHPHTTPVIDVLAARTRLTVKKSIICNFLEAMRLKSGHINLKIEWSTIFNLLGKKNNSSYRKLIVFDEFESLAAYFIESKFYRHSLIKLKNVKYGTSSINIVNSHFESVVLNTGMTLENTSLVSTNSSFSNLISSKGLAKICSSSARFENCNFSKITSHSSGILMFYSNSNVSFVGCQVRSNTVTGKYGAIYLSVNQAIFTNCTFKSNTVTGKGGRGGAISAVAGSHFQIHHCTFKGNQAKYDGGAVYGRNTRKLLFKRCIFENNVADGRNGAGGAISAVTGSHLQIVDCFFKGNQASYLGGAVHMSYTRQSSFLNCIFENNIAYKSRNGYGGAICGYSTATNGNNITNFGQLMLNITSCLFKRNHATYSGGAIDIRNFYMVNIQRTKLEDNVAGIGGGLSVSDLFNLNLSFSCFIRNKAISFGGAILFLRVLMLTVRDSIFKSNYASSGGSIFMEDSQSSFQRCVFENNTATGGNGTGGAIHVYRTCRYDIVFYGHFVTNVERVVATQYRGAFKEDDIFLGGISWCLFKGNKAKISGGAIVSLNNTLYVNNSTFENNTAETGDEGRGGALSLVENLVVDISWCNFTRNKVPYAGGAIHHASSGLLSIRNTRFFDNIAYSSRIAQGGAIFTYSDRKLLWDSSLEINHGFFKGNIAHSVGGAICNLGGTSLSIIASSFQTESYFHNRQYIGGEVIYSMDRIFLSEVLIENMDKINPENSLIIHTSKEKYLEIHGIAVNCYIGKDAIAINSSGISISGEVLTLINVKCASCPPQFYSLSKGMIGPDLINQTHIHCFKCPFGGECKNGQIKASDNFWGHSSKANIEEISFSTCPFGYCCVGNQCKDYNSCRTGRQGILCGQCEKHLTESMGTPDCLKHGDCLNPWFWGIIGTTGAFYVLFFLFQKEIAMLCVTLLVPRHVLSSVKSVVFHNIRKMYEKTLKRESHKELLTDDISFQSDEGEVLQFEPQDVRGLAENSPNSYIFSGFLKIVIYFYQTSVLYKVYSEGKSLRYVSILQEIISTLFNLRTDGLFSQDLLWCPFDHLKAVPKLLFKTSFTFYPVTLILLLLFLSKVFRHFTKSESTSAHYSRLYCCLLRMFIISYSSITKTCFTLLFCINLGPIGKVLYVDGSIKCYQWWQFLDIVAVFIWIGSFPVGIYASSWLMHRNKLSIKGFLLSLLLPLPTTVYFIYMRISYPKKSMKGSDIEEETSITGTIKNESIRELLDVLEGPFRKYNGTDISCSHKLPWESILIVQRLVLIIIRTFLTNILFRLYVMLLFTFLFLVYHIHIQPFSSKLLNYIQTISLTMLVTICALNTVPGYIYMNPLNVSSYMQEISEIFHKIETLLTLVVPFVIGFCIIVLLSIRILQFVHSVVKICTKYICLCCKKKRR